MKYLLILLLVFSCTKESFVPLEEVYKTEEEYNEVTGRSYNSIVYQANQHVSNHGYATYPMNEWSKTVIFTESCKYTTDDPLNQDDWNKLFGVRKSALSNSRNGAYLVWCYPNYPIGHINYDKIRIGWYLHDDDGDFIPMPLSQTVYVNINEPVYLYLKNYNSNFVYSLNWNTYYINKAQYNIDNFSNGWRLSPHFGGQETPDHNVVITINN